MKVNIYKTTQPNTYLAVSAGTPVPPQWAGATYVKTIELSSERPRISLDRDKVLADIKAHGWSVVGVDVVVNVQ